MDDDRIHLSNKGYRLLVSKALGPLVDRHISLYYKRNVAPVQLDLMSRQARMRCYKNNRKAMKLNMDGAN